MGQVGIAKPGLLPLKNPVHRLINTMLQASKLRELSVLCHQCRIAVCVISSTHGLWWINLKICAHVTDVFKMNVKTFEMENMFVEKLQASDF